MENPKVEIGPAIGYGWQAVKKDFWYFVGISFITLVVSSIGSGRDQVKAGWEIISILLSALVTCGYLKLTLSYYDNKKLPFGDFFTQWKYYARVLGANILLGLIIVVGFLFLLIPGIYFGLKYQFTPMFIIDKNVGIGEAMNLSAKLTKGIKMRLLWFALACLGVMILGAIALGVGILVATPVVWLASVYLYRKLSASATNPTTTI
jgi:uncharacterized membrane protein